MPPPDPRILNARPEIAAALERLAPGCVITDAAALRVYECDGLTAYRQPPMIAVLPRTTEQVRAILRLCQEKRVKIVPRGAGTSLSGGALPLADGIVLGMARFDRILDVDPDNRCAVVQPGVTNLAISRAAEPFGLYYAPDPSSQAACTIGGNVAENAGGVHCLKYGLTTNNLWGLECACMDGSLMRLGGRSGPGGGYDLMGLLTGSEGLLGVITEVTVRLLPRPPERRALMLGFATSAEASSTVGAIITAGIIPGGMEMMDRPAMDATCGFTSVAYPEDARALLIVELDGVEDDVARLCGEVERIAREHGAQSVRTSRSEEERLAFWAGRKAAFAAMGRISPDYLCMDGTIPRRRLPEMLEDIAALSRRHGLRVANVFHAGDGNLHPLILYDANAQGETERAEAFGADVLRLCVDKGGVLSGEHGIGVEKRDLMDEVFSAEDLDQQQRVKCAFDPDSLLNPGKVFPRLRNCAELGRMHVHGGKLPFAHLPRF